MTKILLPRNIEVRMEKLQQQNLKLLQQEVIEGGFDINDSWDFGPDQVKTKTINGPVTITVSTGKIPQWLKNVTVNGNFYCGYNKLTSLKGCPETIGGSFYCSGNNLTSLEDCPETVGSYFVCYHNSKKINIEDLPKDDIIKEKKFFINY